jgi:hypothetical protein
MNEAVRPSVPGHRLLERVGSELQVVPVELDQTAA